MSTNAIKAAGSTLQFNQALTAAIPGTRTSATVFTRTAGTWTIDELIGQYCKSYVGGAETTYTWHKIIDNDTTTLTIDGTLLTPADNIKTASVIGEIVSCNGSKTRNVIEVLTCDSTNNETEILAGSRSAGECTVTCIYDPSASGVYNSLVTDFDAGTKATLLATYAGATPSSESCSAIISNLSSPRFGGPDDPVEVDITFRRQTMVYTDQV